MLTQYSSKLTWEVLVDFDSDILINGFKGLQSYQFESLAELYTKVSDPNWDRLGRYCLNSNITESKRFKKVIKENQ